jgi:hypothetical protein
MLDGPLSSYRVHYTCVSQIVIKGITVRRAHLLSDVCINVVEGDYSLYEVIEVRGQLSSISTPCIVFQVVI